MLMGNKNQWRELIAEEKYVCIKVGKLEDGG